MANLARYFVGYPQIVLDIAPADMRRRNRSALDAFLAKAHPAHNTDTHTEPANTEAAADTTPYRAVTTRTVDRGENPLTGR
jgi:hypothetical protein